MSDRYFVYRVREPNKDGGTQFTNIEYALDAAHLWFNDTGIKCFVEYRLDDSEAWLPTNVQVPYIATTTLPLIDLSAG